MRKDVSPAKLQNLSPEKYGKAAWADLTYTPSKLADNVMFREAATLKKN
jgi:flagellar motility protein MotE (MotC chaperone)